MEAVYVFIILFFVYLVVNVAIEMKRKTTKDVIEELNLEIEFFMELYKKYYIQEDLGFRKSKTKLIKNSDIAFNKESCLNTDLNGKEGTIKVSILVFWLSLYKIFYKNKSENEFKNTENLLEILYMYSIDITNPEYSDLFKMLKINSFEESHDYCLNLVNETLGDDYIEKEQKNILEELEVISKQEKEKILKIKEKYEKYLKALGSRDARKNTFTHYYSQSFLDLKNVKYSYDIEHILFLIFPEHEEFIKKLFKVKDKQYTYQKHGIKFIFPNFYHEYSHEDEEFLKNIVKSSVLTDGNLENLIVYHNTVSEKDSEYIYSFIKYHSQDMTILEDISVDGFECIKYRKINNAGKEVLGLFFRKHLLKENKYFVCDISCSNNLADSFLDSLSSDDKKVDRIFKEIINNDE